MIQLSQPFVAAISGLFGLTIGSFLNVVIYRIPKKESIVHPGSHCPNCEAPIKSYDNLPLISWIILRGSCRSCKAPISVRYPLVELLTGVLFATAGFLVHPQILVPAVCVAIAGLLSCALIDLETMKIPTKIVYSTAVVGAPFLVLASGITGQWMRLGISAICALSALLGFFIIFFLAPPGGFGLGDVRLAGLEALFLGWIGWRLVLAAFFLGIALGAIIAIALLAFGIKKMKDAIPFGPFLAMGAIALLIFEHYLGFHWTGFH